MRRIASLALLAVTLLCLSGAAFAQAPSAVPALPDSERRIAYSVSASTGPLSVPFAVYGDGTDYSNWLEVWVGGVKLTGVTDWQFTLTSGTLATAARPLTNGQISFTTAQTGTVQIIGARRPRRTSQFAENRGVAARDLNQVITDIIATARETWDKINDTSGRTIQAPGGETLAVLPTSSVRSGRYALFDGTGNMIQGATQGAVEGATVAALTGTATDTAVIAVGTATFNTQTSRQWLVGTYLTVSNTSDGSAYLHGPITAYNSGTGAVTLNVQDVSGSGSYNSWNLSIAGTRGTIGVTGATGATSIKGVPTLSNFAIFGPTTSTTNVSDGGTTGYGLSYDYTTLKFNTTSPPAAYGAAINARLIPSVASSALTIALKDANGADPTAASPVMVPFRDPNPLASNVSWASVTAATTVSITSGSTMGFANLVPGRVWVVGFFDAGTFRLGAIQNLSGTGIYPLQGWGIASSTAEGGAGAADTSQTFYTGAAVTSKAYTVLGYLTWETALPTAGLWTATPDRVQMWGPGVPLPGTIVQTQQNITGALASGTTIFASDDNVPQNTGGDQYLLQKITPSSKANILEIDVEANFGSSVTGYMQLGLFQDATAAALASAVNYQGSTSVENRTHLFWPMLANISIETTFKARAGSSGAGTTTFNGYGGARKGGGTRNSYIKVIERMN
ncbi:MAG: hypothetical protein ABIO35_08320 [Nitrobacter sp.]